MVSYLPGGCRILFHPRCHHITIWPRPKALSARMKSSRNWLASAWEKPKRSMASRWRRNLDSAESCWTWSWKWEPGKGDAFLVKPLGLVLLRIGGFWGFFSVGYRIASGKIEAWPMVASSSSPVHHWSPLILPQYVTLDRPQHRQSSGFMRIAGTSGSFKLLANGANGDKYSKSLKITIVWRSGINVCMENWYSIWILCLSSSTVCIHWANRCFFCFSGGHKMEVQNRKNNHHHIEESQTKVVAGKFLLFGGGGSGTMNIW